MSLDPPVSFMPQRFRGIFVGAALLAVGRWAANQYGISWTSNSVFDHMKSSVDGQITEPYYSTLTEPWSTVSYPIQVIRVQVYG